MPEYKNYPLHECAKACEKLIAQGAIIYQKWTCEKCGERATGVNPNKLFTHGHHEDCGHVTDLRLAGCNYMIIFSSKQARNAFDVLDQVSKEIGTARFRPQSPDKE